MGLREDRIGSMRCGIDEACGTAGLPWGRGVFQPMHLTLPLRLIRFGGQEAPTGVLAWSVDVNVDCVFALS